MKEKLEQTKGITLIALIITIIVLLILAMVSIRLIMNNGIITKAEKATNDYNVSEQKEQIQLGYSDYQMAKAQGETNPTLKVEGATVTGNESNGWSITFTQNDGTSKTYKLSSTGNVLDFESLKSAALANKEEYLAKASAAGQNTTSNKDIGIGTDGSIVDLDEWSYKKIENSIAIVGEGSQGGGYKGTKENPILPQYILISDYNSFMPVTSLGDPDVNNYGTQPFAFNSTIKKIVIPDTVEHLGEHTFYECSSLESVKIPNSVTNISRIGYGGEYIPVFYHCKTLKEVIIDNAEGAIPGAPWGATNAKITYLR